MADETGKTAVRGQSALERSMDDRVLMSLHLADGQLPDLSELEFGFVMLTHAFQRWMVRCMAAAGVPDLTSTDIEVLHNIRGRNKPRKLADISLVLNIEDTHVVTYSVKKLERMGLVQGSKRGKEKMLEVTDEGRQLCQRYAEIRNRLLIGPLTATDLHSEDFSKIGAQLRALSGYYDQAARSAASL